MSASGTLRVLPRDILGCAVGAEALPRGPLPHPSPRNRRCLGCTPWFDEDVLPALRACVRDVLRA